MQKSRQNKASAQSAFRYNAQCKDLYDRLVARGKPGKVALMTVANKLIRQVFRMVRSSKTYCPDV